MKICIYTGSALPKIGGHELVVDAPAREFHELGHQVVVLAPRSSASWRNPNWPFAYPVVRHPRFVLPKHLLDWYQYPLLRLHDRHTFDVVHVHGIYPAGYVAAVCQERLGIPLVMTSHGWEADPTSSQNQDPRVRARLKHALQSATKLIAISRFVRQGYLNIEPGVGRNIVDLPNGVDLAAVSRVVSRPASLDPRIQPGEYALFLGRLDRRKGIDLALRALAQLPDTGKVQLVVAGEGGERSALEQLTAQLGLTGRVLFTGLALGDQKNYLLQNALFSIAPSRGWEGLPLVPLECFAVGRPVIASDLPGFADIVLPGETGEQVPEESVEPLAAALKRFFADRPYVERLGSQAKQFVQGYSWRAIAERHLDLYRELIEHSRQRRAA